MRLNGYKGFEDKVILDRAAKHTKNVMKLVRNVTCEDYSNDFENNSDELKFLIDKYACL